MNEVKEIPFGDKNLLGIRTEDGNIWLAVRKTCIDIGLNDNQAKAETKKIENSILFSDNVKKLRVKFDPQVREIVVISEKFVPMWLAQINLTPNMRKKNPTAVKRLLKYQLEASNALHKAFYKTEEQKMDFHKGFGIEGEIKNLRTEIRETKSILDHQSELLQKVVNNMTLTTRQQQKLYQVAKERVNHLLGGAHSEQYKKNSRLYFANIWLNLKEKFACGSSYKDLNPMFLNEALGYISNWEYKG